MEQLQLHAPQKITATVAESALRVEMEALEPEHEGAPARMLQVCRRLRLLCLDLRTIRSPPSLLVSLRGFSIKTIQNQKNFSCNERKQTEIDAAKPRRPAAGPLRR